MFNKKILTLISTIMLSSCVYADMTEAKELFDEAKCMECHNNIDFKVKKDKVNSFKKLHNAVKQCSFNTSTGWFDDETLDVVQYLNKEYYKFTDSSYIK
ncbi:MAG: hypothetical protein ACJAWW_001780 [Sulfurimonas sp.]|jgi:uncharacterized protein YrrD